MTTIAANPEGHDVVSNSALEDDTESEDEYLDVQKEEEESQARTAKLTALVQEQEAVLGRIYGQVNEPRTGDSARAGENSTRMTFSRSLPSFSPYESFMSDSVGSQEMLRGSCVVADGTLRRQARLIGFKERRQVMLEEHQISLQRVAQKLEASEARCLERQQEIAEEQRRRAFERQQRRSEQQKMCRELRRDQEHRWELFYSKTDGGKNLPRSSANLHSGRAGSSSPHPVQADSANEDIYTKILRSHGLYEGALNEMRQFVAENERSTDAHWRKMLLGNANCRDTASLDRFRGRGRVLKRHFKDICKIKSFISRTSTKEKLDNQKVCIENEMPANDVIVPQPLQRSDPSASLPRLGTWSEKMQKCREHHETLREIGQQKLEQRDERLNEAGHRRKAHYGSVVSKAANQMLTWELRKEDASKKRAEFSVRSDHEIMQKETHFSHRLDEQQRHQQEERLKRCNTKTERTRQVLANKLEEHQNAVEAGKRRQAEKDDMLSKHARNRIEEFEMAASKGQVYKEQAQAKRDKRDAMHEEFRNNTSSEITSKLSRSMDSFRRGSTKVVDQLREQRKSGLLSPKAVKATSSGNLAETLLSLTSLEPTPRTDDTRRRALAARHGRTIAAADADSASEPDEEELVKELEARSAKWLMDLRDKME